MNWPQIVRKRLHLDERNDRDAVVSELAAHLEETYEAARARGLTHKDAIASALQEVEDWKVLRANICRAKSGEDSMNQRTKHFWLPAIAVLFTIGLALVLLDRADALQRLIWVGCMAMFLCMATSEANHLNERTQRFWLPGFFIMTAATLFLFATEIVYEPSLFFREMSLHPQDLLRFSPASPRSFYFVWLLAQAAFGAIGALLSRRAGGTRTARILAGAIPGVVISGTYLAMIPATSLITGKADISPVPAYFTATLFVWAVVPGFALLLGAAPFLKDGATDNYAKASS